MPSRSAGGHHVSSSTCARPDPPRNGSRRSNRRLGSRPQHRRTHRSPAAASPEMGPADPGSHRRTPGRPAATSAPPPLGPRGTPRQDRRPLSGVLERVGHAENTLSGRRQDRPPDHPRFLQPVGRGAAGSPAAILGPAGAAHRCAGGVSPVRTPSAGSAGGLPGAESTFVGPRRCLFRILVPHWGAAPDPLQALGGLRSAFRSPLRSQGARRSRSSGRRRTSGWPARTRRPWCRSPAGKASGRQGRC